MPKITEKKINDGMRTITRVVLSNLPKEAFAVISPKYFSQLREQYFCLSQSILYALDSSRATDYPLADCPETIQIFYDRWANLILAEWKLLRYSWSEITKLFERKKWNLPFSSPEAMMATILIEHSTAEIRSLSAVTPSKLGYYSDITAMMKDSKRKTQSARLKDLDCKDIEAGGFWRFCLLSVAEKSKRVIIRDRLEDYLLAADRMTEVLQWAAAEAVHKKKVTLT